jgi:hypothetical protein
MGMVRVNTLESQKVEMFEVETKKSLQIFDSLAKAANFCGYPRNGSFNRMLYRGDHFEVTFKGQKKTVYFKEKN